VPTLSIANRSSRAHISAVRLDIGAAGKKSKVNASLNALAPIAFSDLCLFVRRKWVVLLPFAFNLSLLNHHFQIDSEDKYNFDVHIADNLKLLSGS
jgi:hypothetical protein